MALKHKLLGNCIMCGRVVCAQEGYGVCLFCGDYRYDVMGIKPKHCRCGRVRDIRQHRMLGGRLQKITSRKP
jgi:hypothetical protein